MTGGPLRRGKFGRGVLLSLQLLAAHRLRTALSVSGLLIGGAAVMVMAAAGEGAEQDVLARLQAMGTNLLVVSAAPAPLVAGRPRQANVNTTLTAADAAAIAGQSGFAMAVAPAVRRAAVLRWEDRNVATTLTGTTAEGLRIRNIEPGSGRLFDDTDDRGRRRVIVLGPAVARSLFAGADPVGRQIRIGNSEFEVIGVARPRGIDPVGADLDDVAMIPFDTAARRVFNIAYVHAIFVQAASSAGLPDLESEVRGILRARHPARSGAAEPFMIQNQAALLLTERGAAQALNQLVLAVAGIALLLGGIGVITVMQMSVRERTREIGLRRAVGATRGDIRLQFLVESAILAIAGGVAGVMIGIAAAGAAALFGPWNLVLSWPAAALGVACSAAVGLAAGIIPAARAARLEPIEALRAA